MNIYIIVINWKPDLMPDKDNLEKLLEANFKRVKLTEESYLVSSNNSPVEIRNFITNKIPNIGRIFIGEMKESAAWKSMLSESDNIKQIFNNE